MSHKMFCTKQTPIDILKQRQPFLSWAWMGLGVFTKMRGLPTKWPKATDTEFPLSRCICYLNMNESGIIMKTNSTQ